MKATISMNSIWQMIRPLPLDNRKWLSEKLQESIINEDETRMSKEEFFAKVDSAKASIQRGEGTKVSNKQALDSLLNSL